MPTNEELDDLRKQAVTNGSEAIIAVINGLPDNLQAAIIGETLIVLIKGYLNTLDEDAPNATDKVREILRKL